MANGNDIGKRLDAALEKCSAFKEAGALSIEARQSYNDSDYQKAVEKIQKASRVTMQIIAGHDTGADEDLKELTKAMVSKLVIACSGFKARAKLAKEFVEMMPRETMHDGTVLDANTAMIVLKQNMLLMSALIEKYTEYGMGEKK